MSRSRPMLALALVLGVTSACARVSSEVATPSLADQARLAAQQFLDRYVGSDGRVARLDQGNDTVSEGQSYALLLAQVRGDTRRFEEIWRWTARHLLRPDGLLAGRADASGTIVDSNSASDADLVTAWALLRASGGPHASEHHAAGSHLATAILERETFVLPGGAAVLAAGNWATGAPASLNPSYWALPALTGIAQLTGDHRWNDLAAESVRLVSILTRQGARLPPDWARADGATVTATPAPNREAPDVRYSYDAARVPIWFAVGDVTSARLAARWWRVFRHARDDARAALTLDGNAIPPYQRHPIALVATAAAAAAAHDQADCIRLLQEAQTLEHRSPSYYGAAWVALGRAFLTTNLLAGTKP